MTFKAESERCSELLLFKQPVCHRLGIETKKISEINISKVNLYAAPHQIIMIFLRVTRLFKLIRVWKLIKVALRLKFQLRVAAAVTKCCGEGRGREVDAVRWETRRRTSDHASRGMPNLSQRRGASVYKKEKSTYCLLLSSCGFMWTEVDGGTREAVGRRRALRLKRQGVKEICHRDCGRN